MSVLEKYNAALDERAAKMREAAARAKEAGDERQHSICLMQASMLGDMLKMIGKVDHEGIRPDLLGDTVKLMEKQAEEARKRDDFDLEDRQKVKADTIRWAMDTLRGLEAEDE